MRKKSILTITALICTAALLLGGCGQGRRLVTRPEESPPDSTVMLTYSFMYDDETKDEIAEIMQADGVDRETIDSFMATVTQFSRTMGDMKGAHDGYTTVDATKPFYDFEHIGRTFNRELGFDDQNCRLTAYSLFKNFFTVDEAAGFVYEDNSLYGDLEILKGNKNLKFSDDDIKKYTALFSDVKCSPSENSEDFAYQIKESWKNRGVKLPDSKDVQLVSIMFNDTVKNTLYAGHAGVLFQTDQGYLLIEKLSQYTPFVAGKFESLDALNSYLLSEVAGFTPEGDPEPFVMLNDRIIL